MKNFSIITLIFVVPLIAYFLLAKPDPTFANKSLNVSKPQIIKFTSLMCLDCKKLNNVIKEVYPKYSDKIELIEIQVQNADPYTQKQVQKYNITLVPTLVVINSKGKQLNRIEGFIEKERLEKIMKELN
jgi:thiol-disulfide isomerase/thioredoxin